MKDPQEVAQAFSITPKPDLGDGVVELNVAFIPGEHHTNENGGKSHTFANWEVAAEFVAVLVNRLNEHLNSVAPMQEPEPDAPPPAKPPKKAKVSEPEASAT